MKRSSLWWFLLVAVIAPPGAALAATSVGISVNVGTAPAPPVIVFQDEPRLAVVPGSTVFVVDRDCGYDVFRYGVYWYVFQDDYWYRARYCRGPFTAVSARYVPAAIINVPPRYWRHVRGGPSSFEKRRGEYVVMKERERERGRGHERGHRD